MIGLFLFSTAVAIAVFAPMLTPRNSFSHANPALAAPSRLHPFGTDIYQRDLLTLVIRAIRGSMTTVAQVVVLSAAIGTFLGLAAGYFGRWVDDIVSRLAEVLHSVPRFFIAYLVIGLYGPGQSKIVLILGLTSWTLLARVVRAETLSIRQRPYVEASRSAGASSVRIMLRHILPNVAPQALVVVVLLGSRVILIEAGLAFLGLGDPLRPSLGALARNAQPYLRFAWWTALFPGLAISLLVLGMNLLSDGLEQALNPLKAGRLRRR